LNIDDGILTAYEVSNLYLPNTRLVVLSACETGLGDIQGSEGVYGLQRAFKMAGVQNLIMSLWKVPDVETAEFMEIFYSNLFDGKSVNNAFYLAQTQMKNKYRAEPYKWAAWILVQ
jgi:CHAT domain-containing protein